MKNLLVAIALLSAGCVNPVGTPYTPNPTAGTWTAVTLPDDDDLKNGASVNVPFQALADKDARKLDRLSGGDITGFVSVKSGGTVNWENGSSLTTDVSATVIHSGQVAVGTLLVSIAGGIDNNGTLHQHKQSTFEDNAIFNGNSAFNAVPTFNSEIEAVAGIHTLSPSTFEGTVNVAAAISHTAGIAAFVNDTRFSGAVLFNAAAVNTGVIANAGAGHLRLRRIAGANAATTYEIADADVVNVDIGGITNNRIYTLSSTGAVNGDVIQFVNQDPTFTITVHGVPLKSVTGQMYQASFIFNGPLAVWDSLNSSVTP